MTQVPHLTELTLVRQPKRAALALIVSSTLTLAACGSSDQSGEPEGKTAASSEAASAPSASPNQSGTSDDPEKAAVLRTYDRFWEEQVKAYSQGETAGTEFAKYAAAQALANTERDLKDLRSKGILTTGAPSHEASVDKLQPDKEVPYARLTDCLDSADWKFVYAGSRKPVEMPEGRLIRYVTEVEVEKWGKQWKVITVTPQQRAC
ncbi:hypothetical protein [Streptomyces sp. MN13]